MLVNSRWVPSVIYPPLGLFIESRGGNEQKAKGEEQFSG